MKMKSKFCFLFDNMLFTKSHCTYNILTLASNRNMKLVARNKARRESGMSNDSSSGKKPKSSGGGVQVGLHAFFKRPSNSQPSASATKRQKTPPTSPDHSEVDVITIDD